MINYMAHWRYLLFSVFTIVILTSCSSDTDSKPVVYFFSDLKFNVASGFDRLISTNEGEAGSSVFVFGKHYLGFSSHTIETGGCSQREFFAAVVSNDYLGCDQDIVDSYRTLKIAKVASVDGLEVYYSSDNGIHHLNVIKDDNILLVLSSDFMNQSQLLDVVSDPLIHN